MEIINKINKWRILVIDPGRGDIGRGSPGRHRQQPFTHELLLDQFSGKTGNIGFQRNKKA